jgi:hypothetical protein
MPGKNISIKKFKHCTLYDEAFIFSTKNLPAKRRSLAHLVRPCKADFISGVNPSAFLASTSTPAHRLSSRFNTSTWPEIKKKCLFKSCYSTINFFICYVIYILNNK